MSIDWGGLFALVGPASVAIALMVMGLLSRRLGSVMRTPRYYVGFFIAAALMILSVLARVLNVGHGDNFAASLGQNAVSVILYIGLPSIAITIGLIVAWRYWSWLLAERG
jgi:hypothetical protein